jgi:Asp-tRNA(Asn)/Glu-tRNA(Gln) amidotransferase A subunit family amidase
MASATLDDLLCQGKEPRHPHRKALEESGPSSTWPEVAETVIKAGEVARIMIEASGFGLMHTLHMDAFKKVWLPGMNHAATGESYFKLVQQLMELRKTYGKVMTDNRIDVLLYPSTKVPNTPNDGDAIAGKGPLGNILPETLIGANMLFAPAQMTPSVSLYSGMDKAGLPLSVTIDGYSGEDRKLLDVAEAIEKVLPPVAEPKTI